MQKQTWNAIDCATFKKTKDRFGMYSNMSAHKVVIGPITARTSEALYQAFKYPLYPEIQQRIIDQKSPMSAKMVQKNEKANMRVDWDELRVAIMSFCVSLKVIQHKEEYLSLLNETSGKHIVENSTRDDFWGAVPQTDGTLYGVNALGRIHMRIRDLIEADEFDWSIPVCIDTDNMILLGINIKDYYTQIGNK